MWRLADTLPKGLEAEDGRRFRIIYPGRPGGAAGPDFRDALIEGESGERVTGDVELHIAAPDWYRHRHHEDPAYNGVVLHPKGSAPSSDRKARRPSYPWLQCWRTWRRCRRGHVEPRRLVAMLWPGPLTVWGTGDFFRRLGA